MKITYTKDTRNGHPTSLPHLSLLEIYIIRNLQETRDHWFDKYIIHRFKYSLVCTEFRIYKHGLKTSKHVRASRHVILGTDRRNTPSSIAKNICQQATTICIATASGCNNTIAFEHVEQRAGNIITKTEHNYIII